MVWNLTNGTLDSVLHHSCDWEGKWSRVKQHHLHNHRITGPPVQPSTEQSKLLWSGEMGFHQPLGRWGGTGKPGLCQEWRAGWLPHASLPPQHEILLSQDATLESFISHAPGSIINWSVLASNGKPICHSWTSSASPGVWGSPRVLLGGMQRRELQLEQDYPVGTWGLSSELP